VALIANDTAEASSTLIGDAVHTTQVVCETQASAERNGLKRKTATTKIRHNQTPWRDAMYNRNTDQAESASEKDSELEHCQCAKIEPTFRNFSDEISIITTAPSRQYLIET
jgi:hypothetical protein